jgi:hypothetical protein
MRQRRHASVVVVRSLATVHATQNLVVTCSVVVALALFLCAASLPYTALLLLMAARVAEKLFYWSN